MRIRSQNLARWAVVAILLGIVIVAPLYVRLPARTANNPALQRLEIPQGYRVRLVNVGPVDGPFLTYETGRPGERHYLVLEGASLANPPPAPEPVNSNLHTQGRFSLSSDTDGARASGPPCTYLLTVEFPAHARGSSFTMAPADIGQPGTESDRVIHLSGAEFLVRVANNSDGSASPGCRSTLKPPVGSALTLEADTSLVFRAAEVDLVVRSTQTIPEDVVTLQPLAPEALYVSMGSSNPDVVRELRNTSRASFVASDLRLGSRGMQIMLAGVVAMPLNRVLGVWRWPMTALIGVLLLVWAARPRKQAPRALPEIAFETPAAPAGCIFLSYSWADRDQVIRVHDAIRDAGGSPWMDRREMRGGEEWIAAVEANLRSAAHVLIFLSSQSLKRRGFVWREMRMAADIALERPPGENYIIPVKIDPCEIPHVIGRWNAIELYESDGIEQVLASLALRSSRAANAAG